MPDPGADPATLTVLALASEVFVTQCHLVGDRWHDPTPCSDWDVGQLVDHVIGGNRFTVAMLGGRPAADALRAAIASFGTDADAGVDRLAAAVGSTAAQADAFGEPGALTRRCDHVAGEVSGEEALRLRVHELIIHGWDLAEALHPPALVAAPLLTWALADLARTEALAARHFAVERPAPTTTDPQKAFFAAFGRLG